MNEVSNQKEIKMQHEVMTRVHAIHHLRTVTRPFFVELGLFAVSIISIGFMVSVPNVLSNAMHSGGVLYIARSLVHTKALVQVAIAFGAVMFLLLARELAKNLKPQLARVV